MGRRWWSESLRFIGWRADSTSHQEKLISALGATLALLVVYWITHIGLDGEGALWVTGSMGASAVLVFAMPHGALSQPWPVIGGQVISASFGVACMQWLPASPWVAALAVGGSIILMMYARCLHPPGGATAMIVVLGGPAIQEAGYHFVLYPILLDAAVIVGAAILFNSLFDWRRYPLALAHHQVSRPPGIAPEDFHHALRQMDSFVDIRFDELLKLVELANNHARTQSVGEADLLVGGYYSNGLPGDNWAVREVTQVTPRLPGRTGRVRYKTIKGKGEGTGGICSLSRFVSWARYAVEQDETGWHRVRGVENPKDKA